MKHMGVGWKQLSAPAGCPWTLPVAFLGSLMEGPLGSQSPLPPVTSGPCRCKQGPPVLWLVWGWACTACLPGGLCVHCVPFQSLGPSSAGRPDQVFTEEGPKAGGEKVENNCGLPDVSPWVFPARQRPARCSRPTQKLPSLSDGR